MTNEVTFQAAITSPPEALIQFDADALKFAVGGVEVFRLTSSGMEYKGQIVEDAGVAYREITAFFSAAKEAMLNQSTTGQEQALAVLDDCADGLDGAHENVLRRALEALDD